MSTGSQLIQSNSLLQAEDSFQSVPYDPAGTSVQVQGGRRSQPAPTVGIVEQSQIMAGRTGYTVIGQLRSMAQFAGFAPFLAEIPEREAVTARTLSRSGPRILAKYCGSSNPASLN